MHLSYSSYTIFCRASSNASIRQILQQHVVRGIQLSKLHAVSEQVARFGCSIRIADRRLDHDCYFVGALHRRDAKL